jgi:hypothetical protein
MGEGKRNVVAGLILLAGFMVFGFVLIYLRDFAPGKAEWIAAYSTGKHFESRLAHVHGNLFALLNLAYGTILAHLDIPVRTARWISWLTVAGLMMPIGILAEVTLGVPPIFVLVGGVAMVAATVWLAVAVVRSRAAIG